jgi:hypothetical protein
MTLVAKSDQSTGNPLYASYVLQSHELVFSFTAPYSCGAPRAPGGAPPPLPGFSHDTAYEFLKRHGLAVRAVGESPGGRGPQGGKRALRGGCRVQGEVADLLLQGVRSSESGTPRRRPLSKRPQTNHCHPQARSAGPRSSAPRPAPCPPRPPLTPPKGLLVEDAADAYAKATANGGVGVLPPAALKDCEGGAGGSAVVSEVKLYGDVVLRFVSGDYKARRGARGGGGGRIGGRRPPCFSGAAPGSGGSGGACCGPTPNPHPTPARRAPTSRASSRRPRRRGCALGCGGWTTLWATPTTSLRPSPTS